MTGILMLSAGTIGPLVAVSSLASSSFSCGCYGNEIRVLVNVPLKAHFANGRYMNGWKGERHNGL